MNEPSGLIARIRQVRRATDSSGKAARKTAPADETTALELLQTRVEHLEQLVEGLQDSIHRESERQGRRITELEARMEPGAISVALSKDARDRGL
jgi:K+/H+ antiporter YhaU regulatory subunit KhtT